MHKTPEITPKPRPGGPGSISMQGGQRSRSTSISPNYPVPRRMSDPALSAIPGSSSAELTNSDSAWFDGSDPLFDQSLTSWTKLYHTDVGPEVDTSHCVDPLLLSNSNHPYANFDSSVDDPQNQTVDPNELVSLGLYSGSYGETNAVGNTAQRPMLLEAPFTPDSPLVRFQSTAPQAVMLADPSTVVFPEPDFFGVGINHFNPSAPFNHRKLSNTYLMDRHYESNPNGYHDYSGSTYELPAVTTNYQITSPKTSRRASGVSANSLSPVVNNQRFLPETPVKKTKWHRINVNTKGKSSRTGKINNYHAEQMYKRCPRALSTWKSPQGRTFNYDENGELSRNNFTAAELHDFVMNHPPNQANPKGLTLWIQRTPADTASRYSNQSSSKCRFADCPGNVFSRSIQVGHYRVAFDERWSLHHEAQDPYHVAGYAHLYCMERFLDFAKICEIADVRADERDLNSEPRGKFAASLGRGSEEFAFADKFIRYCKRKAHCDLISGYPDHYATPVGEAKNHSATLNHMLFKCKVSGLNESKRAQFTEMREVTASQFLEHMGDLAFQVDAKREKAILKRRENAKRRKRIAEGASSEEDLTPQKRKVPTTRKKRINSQNDSDNDFSFKTRPQSLKRKASFTPTTRKKRTNSQNDSDDEFPSKTRPQSSKRKASFADDVSYDTGRLRKRKRTSYVADNAEETEQPNSFGYAGPATTGTISSPATKKSSKSKGEGDDDNEDALFLK